jgi:hypothetical protein
MKFMKFAAAVALAAMTLAATAAIQPQTQLKMKPGTVTGAKIAADACTANTCKGRKDGVKKDDTPVMTAQSSCPATGCKLGRRD